MRGKISLVALLMAIVVAGLLAAPAPFATPRQPRLRHVLARKQNAHCFAVSEDGTRLAVGGGDGHLTLFDLGTGKRLARFRASRDAVAAVAIHSRR